jgi:NAD(P)-dependent dehydrogenase (short-subunit alcohol dehydrogenase family)
MTSITTPITTPFGFHSTAAEIVADVDLSGKRAIVTGAASGIGVETARALAGAGADVTLAVRNPQAGADIAAEITASTRNPAVQTAQLELTNPQSIYRFVGSWRGPLHILVNNAGVMASPEAHTDDGWESQFATNHLGHFALALGLQPALAAADGARIVAVSSSGHLRSPVVFDDINFRFRPYDPLLAYGQSKTANVLFAVGATSRWSEHGIYANALNPGAIQSNLQRHVGGRSGPHSSSRRARSRAQRHPSSWRRRRYWTASVDGTSPTATRRPSSTIDPKGSPCRPQP